MNVYTAVIIAILCARYLLQAWVDVLNLRHARTELPAEFAGYYDAARYRKSQVYLKERTRFGLVEDGVFLAAVLVFMLSGGFNALDRAARGFGFAPLPTGLIFIALLMLLSQALSIPFSAYETFAVEARYGFNKTAPKTFVLDILKTWLLAAVLGGAVFAGVLRLFTVMGKNAWIYCWIGVTLFEFFLVFIAPAVILPLFNKFVPLPEGPLRSAIEDYARRQNFRLQGIFTMDASRRSAKSNAFFTGFGRFRRIVLFDTLIAKHTISELLSILAHEIGHYKKGHVLKMMLFSAASGGVMFFILSLFLENEKLFAAFRMEQTSVYAGLVFFGFLYTPINMIFSVLGNVLSRRHEYEADRFAASAYPDAEAFIRALKKLSVDNLSNLTPHPLKVFLSYSHPPVLQRIAALRRPAAEQTKA